MHYVTPPIKIKYFTSTKYPPQKNTEDIFMRYRRQSVQKHCTKLTLSALQCVGCSLLPAKDEDLAVETG